MRRPRVVGALVGATLIGLALVMTAVICGLPPERSVGVLNGLPKMPGSHRVSIEVIPARDADGNLTGKFADDGAEAKYEAAAGITAQQVIDFFVSELKGDWCYKTSRSHTYDENGELVDGQTTGAIFQGHGSTILMNTQRVPSDRVTFRITVGPTYKKDPDIDHCEH